MCSRVETIDGSAVGGQDFVTFNQVIQFEAGELEKIVSRNTRDSIDFSKMTAICIF